jgi:hypothetical protein
MGLIPRHPGPPVRVRWYCRTDGYFEEETGADCPICGIPMDREVGE